MNCSDAEYILKYLSGKFNKIFCDREFVGRVSRDFECFKHDNKCVLVFPALASVYLRAVRYQANASDLAAFTISTGKVKSIAVCRKDKILQYKSNIRSESDEQAMSQKELSVRRKRPERQFYIPPAQRKSRYRLQNAESDEIVRVSKPAKIESKTVVGKERMARNVRKDQTDARGKLEKLRYCRNCAISNFEKRFPFFRNDTMLMLEFNLMRYLNLNYGLMENMHSYNFYERKFHKHDKVNDIMVPLYTNERDDILYTLVNNRFYFYSKTDFVYQETSLYFVTYPVFNFRSEPHGLTIRKYNENCQLSLNQTILLDKLLVRDKKNQYYGIFGRDEIGNLTEEVEIVFNEDFAVSDVIKVVCDSDIMKNVVDLTKSNLGHFVIIPYVDGAEYIYICQEQHDIRKCYMEAKKKLEVGTSMPNPIPSDTKSSKTQETDKSVETPNSAIDSIDATETAELNTESENSGSQQNINISEQLNLEGDKNLVVNTAKIEVTKVDVLPEKIKINKIEEEHGLDIKAKVEDLKLQSKLTMERAIKLCESKQELKISSNLVTSKQNADAKLSGELEQKGVVMLELPKILQEADLPTALASTNTDKTTISKKGNIKTKLPENKLSIKGGKDKQKITTANELDQEKEIMRKTKENIRKIRSTMKSCGNVNDLLQIDKQDVNNWEDLFDANGEIQDDLLLDIASHVGTNATIVQASSDYTGYGAKATDELDHVVELYGFPASLGTADLIHAFQQLDSDSLYVKWVDNTHALLVLGSALQAQKAIDMDNAFIKARPLAFASPASIVVAQKSDLKPAMKRPPTTLTTARRLITTHLGARNNVSKEQSDKEKEQLRNAREQKKLSKQNERDAWEGNIRSSKK